MSEASTINVKGICDEAFKLYPKNCSGAVRYLATKVGYPLPDKDANGLIDHFEQGWEEVNEHRAVLYANQGRLVVAGKKGIPHGHIVVVLPGGKIRSGGYDYVVRSGSDKGKTKTSAYHGDYPISCSTSMGGWEGALSSGDKSVFDAWGSKGYGKVKYWVAPVNGPA